MQAAPQKSPTVRQYHGGCGERYRNQGEEKVTFVRRASPHDRPVENRDEVKGLRIGLFSSNPPVTRVVLDLNGPQPFQVFPSGRTVIVKVGEAVGQAAAPRNGSGPMLVNTNYPTSAAHLSVPTAEPSGRRENPGH